MPRSPRRAGRVSTLELLFDLVFVVTVGQLARTVAENPGWESVGRATLLVVVVWWMYDAFAWLTNEAVPDTAPVRVLLIAAMAGFLVLSLAIPEAFASSAVAFGVAYVVIALIHAGLFVTLGGASSARVMLRVGPLNVAIGLALIGAELVHSPLRWAMLAAPVVLILVAMTIARRTAFDLAAEHFVERHGLLMIIALGESVVSVTAGVGAGALDLETVIAAVLVVVVIAALWWCYFVGDDERASVAFEAVDPHARTTAALRAFYLDHAVMLLGLVLLGAGLHLALEEPFHAPGTIAGLLVGAGVGLFLLGDADYRFYLGLGVWWSRVVAAVLSVAVGAAGSVLPAAWLLAAVAAVVVATIGVERTRWQPGRSEG